MKCFNGGVMTKQHCHNCANDAACDGIDVGKLVRDIVMRQGKSVAPAVAAERERCAKVAQHHYSTMEAIGKKEPESLTMCQQQMIAAATIAQKIEKGS